MTFTWGSCDITFQNICTCIIQEESTHLFLLLNLTGINLLKNPPPGAGCEALAPPVGVYCWEKDCGEGLRVPYAYVLRAGVFLVKLGLAGMAGMFARSMAGLRCCVCGAVLQQKSSNTCTSSSLPVVSIIVHVQYLHFVSI